MAIPFLPIALGLLGIGEVAGGFERARAVASQKQGLKVQAQAGETEAAARNAERMARLRQVLAANTASAVGLGLDPSSASVLAVQESSARDAYRGSALDRALGRAESSALRGQAGALSPTAQIFGGFLRGGSRLLPLLRERPETPSPRPPDRGLR